MFNVNAERKRVITSLDVAAEAGADTPLDKHLTATGICCWILATESPGSGS